ncbi:hypothetical protein D5072_10370 [Dickeya dianthicola]|nr:hypothetical protein D5072_10370 [Dickeya dianthicola]
MVTLSSQRHDNTAGTTQVKYNIYPSYFTLPVRWLSYSAHKWASPYGPLQAAFKSADADLSLTPVIFIDDR